MIFQLPRNYSDYRTPGSMIYSYHWESTGRGCYVTISATAISRTPSFFSSRRLASGAERLAFPRPIVACRLLAPPRILCHPGNPLFFSRTVFILFHIPRSPQSVSSSAHTPWHRKSVFLLFPRVNKDHQPPAQDIALSHSIRRSQVLILNIKPWTVHRYLKHRNEILLFLNLPTFPRYLVS